MAKEPFIVGITGGSASGKTYFLNSLLKNFSEKEISLISQDNYYKARHLVPLDCNEIENFDLPESIDFDLYAQHIKTLCEGEPITFEEYTFDSLATPKLLRVEPAPILVVEGIFVFHDPIISKMLDLKVFIDAVEHIKIRRRIIRDNNERGYDLESVLYRWENHVAPTYERFIKPTKQDADLIINNNRDSELGLDILSSYLRKVLNSKELHATSV